MRPIIAILISLAVVALIPQASVAEELVASRSAVETPPPSVELASEPAADSALNVGTQEIIIATVALGGAFALGVIAGGSVGTGLVAASVLAISYSVLP